MHTSDFPRRILVGAGAGIAGTLVIAAAEAICEAVAPQSLPRSFDEPDAFVVDRAKKALLGNADVPKSILTAAMLGSRLMYGATFGAAYTLLRPDAEHPILEGAIFGAGVWAVGYLGWLPAAGLTKPVWKEEPKRTLAEIGRHAAYGIATLAAVEAING